MSKLYSDLLKALREIAFEKGKTSLVEELDKEIQVNAAKECMLHSIDEQDLPCVGPFFYDNDKNELYGCNIIALAKDLQFSYSPIWNKYIRTSAILHQTIWNKGNKRGNDKRFNCDMNDNLIGRVFEFKDEGFKAIVGDWINDYPEAKKEILEVFQLPNGTEFIVSEIYNIDSYFKKDF